MRFILLFFSAFIFVGCSENLPNTKNEIISKSKLANQAKRKAATKLHQMKNLRPIGSGSQMMDQIKMLALSFNYYEPLGVEKARELLLAATDELIFAVNEDERIRPYLNNFPFESKNVEIRIFLYNPDGSNPPSGKLSAITAVNGILEYDIDDPKNKFISKTILKETYEEAVLKQEKTIASKARSSEVLSLSSDLLDDEFISSTSGQTSRFGVEEPKDILKSARKVAHVSFPQESSTWKKPKLKSSNMTVTFPNEGFDYSSDTNKNFSQVAKRFEMTTKPKKDSEFVWKAEWSH